MIAKIEVQKATADDLRKVDKLGVKRLNRGQIYYIADPEDETHMSAAFVLDGSEDGFILKLLLEAELLYIPMENLKLKEYIKDE